MESKVSEGGLNVTLTIRLLMHGKVQAAKPPFATVLGGGTAAGGGGGGACHWGPWRCPAS